MLLPGNCFHIKAAYARLKCIQVQVDWNHQKALNVEMFEVWSNFVIGWFLILSNLRLNSCIKWQTVLNGTYLTQESFVKKCQKRRSWPRCAHNEIQIPSTWSGSCWNYSPIKAGAYTGDETLPHQLRFGPLRWTHCWGLILSCASQCHNTRYVPGLR